MQGKMPRKKINAKKKVKKKIHAEGRSHCDFFRNSEFLSESLSFRNQQYYQVQYMNKQKSLSLKHKNIDNESRSHCSKKSNSNKIRAEGFT